MIIVRLIGGMGNQMFQYAAARALSLRRQCQMVVDMSLCADAERVDSSGLSLRPFGLDVFGITGEKLDDAFFRRTLWVRKEHRLRRCAMRCLHGLVSCVSDAWKIGIIERKDITFDKSILNLPANTVLKGYFPAFSYFAECEKTIRDDFTFRTVPDEANAEMIRQISGCQSVSLHVRRGDYVSNERTSQNLGVCSPRYYERAVQTITGAVPNPHFFIFTNDPEYVKTNLKIDFPAVFVTHNAGPKSFEDMRLMSLCRHNIIANSSFSWWGAWLNVNPDKVVVAPSPAAPGAGLKDHEFYPPSWKLAAKT